MLLAISDWVLASLMRHALDNLQRTLPSANPAIEVSLELHHKQLQHLVLTYTGTWCYSSYSLHARALPSVLSLQVPHGAAYAPPSEATDPLRPHTWPCHS